MNIALSPLNMSPNHYFKKYVEAEKKIIQDKNDIQNNKQLKSDKQANKN